MLLLLFNALAFCCCLCYYYLLVNSWSDVVPLQQLLAFTGRKHFKSAGHYRIVVVVEGCYYCSCPRMCVSECSACVNASGGQNFVCHNFYLFVSMTFYFSFFFFEYFLSFCCYLLLFLLIW